MNELGYAATVLISVLLGAWLNHRASHGRSPIPFAGTHGRVESADEPEQTKRRSKM